MAKSTAAVIGRVLQIRLHGELTLDSRQDPLGHHHHMEPVCAFSVPPEQDLRLLGEVQAGPGGAECCTQEQEQVQVQSGPVLVQSVARPDESSVQCAEELGRRLSTFRGTESNLYCNALYHHS